MGEAGCRVARLGQVVDVFAIGHDPMPHVSPQFNLELGTSPVFSHPARTADSVGSGSRG